VEQAKALAARPEVSSASGEEAKVAALYRLVLMRKPEKGETAAALQFVKTAPAADAKLSIWEMFAQVLLQTNEVMFVD
jgi:hypothetical protein